MRQRGTIQAWVGGVMCSGKTDKVLRILRKLQRHGNGNIRHAAFKPTTDTRSGLGKISSKPDGDTRGDSIDAFEIPTAGDGPWEILRHLKEEEARIGPVQLVIVDEINFFPVGPTPTETPFFNVVLRLLELGYDLILSGLVYDYRDLPFGCTLLLAGMARDKCIWRTAYCAKCGKDGATHSQALNADGTPLEFNAPQEQVDGTDKRKYEPRCDDCWVVPGRPIPKY